MRYLTAAKIHDGFKWLPEGSIIALSEDGGVERVLMPGETPPAGVEQYPGFLCPGFVNAHCHLELSHMKGQIPEHTGLVPFLQRVATGRNTTSGIQECIRKSVSAMRDNGIVAVGDIANTTDTLSHRKDSGLHFHTFVESLGFIETAAEARFNASLDTYSAFAAQTSAGNQLLRQSIVPHAPYSVATDLFQRINSFEPEAVISIHNQECIAEDDFFRRGTGEMLRLYETLRIDTSFFRPTGLSSVQSYWPLLAARNHVLLVHNTYTSIDDLTYLQPDRDRVFLTLCPAANLYIENTLPPVEAFAGSGFNICLGTDSLASNHSLSIWNEVCILLQHFKNLDVAQVLSWATSGGAKALRMDHIIGSIQPGKKPGILCIERMDTISVIQPAL